MGLGGSTFVSPDASPNAGSPAAVLASFISVKQLSVSERNLKPTQHCFDKGKVPVCNNMMSVLKRRNDRNKLLTCFCCRASICSLVFAEHIHGDDWNKSETKHLWQKHDTRIKNQVKYFLRQLEKCCTSVDGWSRRGHLQAGLGGCASCWSLSSLFLPFFTIVQAEMKEKVSANASNWYGPPPFVTSAACLTGSVFGCHSTRERRHQQRHAANQTFPIELPLLCQPDLRELPYLIIH